MLMGSEDESPESIEELEKEIEELEKIEIEVGEKPRRKKEKGFVLREKRFRLSSVIVGFLMMLIYLLALGMISFLGTGGDLYSLLYDYTMSILITQLFFPNIVVAMATNSLDIFLGGAGILTAYASILLGVYSGTIYTLLGTTDMYIILILIGLMPYLLAGVIAGAINRDPGYGFVAGVLIWIVSLILGIVVVLYGNIGGLATNIMDAILEYISCGWLSAVFLAIFGALGGASRK